MARHPTAAKADEWSERVALPFTRAEPQAPVSPRSALAVCAARRHSISAIA
jgi:hypothetical protein